MRILNFRALDLNCKLVYFQDLITRQDWDGGIWHYKVYVQDGYSCNKMPEIKDFIEIQRNTIQQGAGIFDKNVTEIYEGDFIKIHADPSIKWNNSHITKVIFDKGCFTTSYGLPIKTNLSFTEVIGNIFENPELLK